jgi:crossover junction endodeoxyribonuclease RuvC
MNYYIGIDPGISGAVAILDKKGDIVLIFDMPTVEIKVGSSMKKKIAPAAIVDELLPFTKEPCIALIEKVGARPGEGAVSMFGFGRSLGVIEGVLAALQVPYSLVAPTVWTKAMRTNPGKDGSREKAMELWPKDAAYFKRVKDNGRSDAALIAKYLLTKT